MDNYYGGYSSVAIIRIHKCIDISLSSLDQQLQVYNMLLQGKSDVYLAVNIGGGGWRGGVKSSPEDSTLAFFFRGL